MPNRAGVTQLTATPEQFDIIGAPHHEGIGLFARLGFADEQTNPIEWAVSGGIGGRGLVPGRHNDTFGLGYYYDSV
jgi:porin